MLEIRQPSKLILALAILAAWAVPNLGAQNSKANGGKPHFTLTLGGEATTVKRGSPILVNVVLKNDSSHEIAVYRENADDQGGFVYKVEVWDVSGARVPLTTFARWLDEDVSPDQSDNETHVSLRSGAYRMLGPGDTITDRISLDKLAELNKPGKYIIQFRRFDEGTKLFVKSNKIKITVAP
jgi:hypothetical protein